MRFAERNVDTTIQSKGERDPNITDAEDDSMVLEPCCVFEGDGLPAVYLEGLHDALGLLLECREFANTLIFPVKYFRLLVKV